MAASGLSQAQPTAKTLLLVPDAAALRDVIKAWSLHCNKPIATLKVVAVGQGSTAALATAQGHQIPPWDQMVIEEAHRTSAEPVADAVVMA
ncbi:hypothetical protein [Streptomyces sp. NPDC019224]|uniref:hypothetical protein n=1 Tax=Streptomyces sp. NPDC019224 TaxID=3154484 RepID=UPI0033CD9D82